jgi:hypothetical protein
MTKQKQVGLVIHRIYLSCAFFFTISYVWVPLDFVAKLWQAKSDFARFWGKIYWNYQIEMIGSNSSPKCIAGLLLQFSTLLSDL